MKSKNKEIIKKANPRRLSLTRETVRRLDRDELEQVAAGMIATSKTATPICDGFNTAGC